MANRTRKVRSVTLAIGSRQSPSVLHQTIAVRPRQKIPAAGIASATERDGADNTFAMGDHADHIHVGWRPLYGDNKEAAKQINAILKPNQWIKLIGRLKEIDNPTVSLQPSKYSVKVTRRASDAHTGE